MDFLTTPHSLLQQDPWLALAGGALIGLSAVLLLLFYGRIAGISTLVSGFFYQETCLQPWRWAFLLGLFVGGMVLMSWAPELIGTPPSEPSPWRMALAGVLVGFGARISNGCTSGHGVCGLGRRSLRSLFATLTFMATGMLTVFVTHGTKGAP